MRGRLMLWAVLLAGCTVVALVAAVVNPKRVSMQTRGAEPKHYWFPPNSPLDSLNSPVLTSTSTVAHDLACSEKTLAVADIARGLSLYKWGSWRQPVSTLKPRDVRGYWRVVIQEHLAYALTIRGFDVIDISQLERASIIGSYLTGTENRSNPFGDRSTSEESSLLGGQHTRFDVSGAYAYVTDDESDLHVVDITNPARPKRVGTLDLGSPWAGLRLTAVAAGPDSMVYVGVSGISGHRGVQVVDVAIPTRPRQLSFTKEGHEPGLVLNGGMLFVVSRQTSPFRTTLTIFRTGQMLTKISELIIDSRSSRIVKICGNRVLIAFAQPREDGFSTDRGYSGVELIDIADPARPRLVERFSTPGLAQAAIIANGTTLIAGGVAGLMVRH
jgi:hypothetical protein